MVRSLIIPKRLVGLAQSRGHKVNHEKTAHLREVSKPRGLSEGGWIDRMASRANAIVLCRSHQVKFDHKAHNYYKDRKFPYVQGKCSACGEWDNQSALYIHESYLSDSNGRTKHGQCWTPK